MVDTLSSSQADLRLSVTPRLLMLGDGVDPPRNVPGIEIEYVFTNVYLLYVTLCYVLWMCMKGCNITCIAMAAVN